MTREIYTPITLDMPENSLTHQDIVGVPFASGLAQSHNLYHQTSRLHNRSFEDSLVSGNVIWGDEFGTRFTSRTIKGLPPDGFLPWIEEDLCMDSGVRVHFLCDDVTAERAKEASHILRSSGLPTERLVSVNELKSLNVRRDLLTPGELALIESSIKEIGLRDAMVEVSVALLKEIMITRMHQVIKSVHEGTPATHGSLEASLAKKTYRDYRE